MKPFLLKVADVLIGVKPLSEMLEHYVHWYLAEEGTPDFSVEITEEDVRNESEYLALQRKVTEGLLDYGVILFHSSLMSVDGFGYAYSAPSGTGKSTHTEILRRVYGNRVKAVNDDKPFLRITDKCIYAYGTPWAGKMHLQNNIRVPLHGICFIHQAKENSIERIKPFDAFVKMMMQVYRPSDPAKVDKMMGLTEKVLKAVPCYSMGCNMEDEAAIMSYTAMSRVRFEDLFIRDGEVTYKTRGDSMQPMLRENRDVVVIKSIDLVEPKKYDVVLFKRENDPHKYVLHRIIRIRNGAYDITGDNRYGLERGVKREQVLGVLTSFIRDGREIPVTDKKYRLYVHLWCDFFWVREGILWLKAKTRKLFSKKGSVNE